MLYLAWNLIGFMVRWIGHYPVVAFPVVVVLLIVYGVAGHDYGLPNLFRPAVLAPSPGEFSIRAIAGARETRTQFVSGFAVMGLFALVALVVHVLDRMRYKSPDTLQRKLVKLSRSFRYVAPWHWLRRRRESAGDLYQPAMASILVPCEALAALALIPAFLDLPLAPVAGSGWASLRRVESVAEVGWGWLLGILAGLGCILGLGRAIRRLVPPERFNRWLDFRYIREDPKFKWVNFRRMGALLGLFPAAYLGLVLVFQGEPPFLLPVSVLLCILLGLWVVLFAFFKVFDRSRRVLVFGSLLVLLFYCNGTDLAGHHDAFKLRFPHMTTGEPAGGGGKTPRLLRIARGAGQPEIPRPLLPEAGPRGGRRERVSDRDHLGPSPRAAGMGSGPGERGPGQYER